MGKKATKYNVKGSKDSELGAFIRERMDKLGLSREDLARKLKVSASRVSQLFSSYKKDSYPHRRTILKLAKALDVKTQKIETFLN